MTSQKKIHGNLLLCVAAFVTVVAGVLFTVLSCQEKPKEEEDYSKYIIRPVALGKYVYIDRGKIIHTKKDCKAVFKDHNAQSIDIVPVNHVWAPSSGLQNICSVCVTDCQIEQLDSITSSIAYHDRRWLYKKLINEYDLKDWNSFNVQLDDEDNRRLLYNEIKNKYDLGTFEEFNRAMTNYSEK